MPLCSPLQQAEDGAEDGAEGLNWESKVRKKLGTEAGAGTCTGWDWNKARDSRGTAVS